MKRWISKLALALGLVLSSNTAQADFNLLNIDLGSPDARRAESLYGQAYGYDPMMVAPVMAAPAEEMPAIMQLAQAAGTLPMSIWMLRQTGMNYGQIMQSFAVAPLVGLGQPVTDAYYIDRARQNFLVERLRVDPVLLSGIPLRGPDFTRFIITPVHPKIGYWMPPGQAKKYGMWIPPGQAKKMGLWDGQWSHDRWRGWDWEDKDWKDWDGPEWKGKDSKWDSKGMSGKPDKGSPSMKSNKGDKGDKGGPSMKSAKGSKGDKGKGNGGQSKGGSKGGGKGGGKGKH